MLLDPWMAAATAGLVQGECEHRVTEATVRVRTWASASNRYHVVRLACLSF